MSGVPASAEAQATEDAEEAIVVQSDRRYAGETIKGALDAGTITSGARVLAGTSKKRGLARILPFLGPAFIACVAYIDPGNFATNIQAGAQFGYLLVWVILAANFTAMLVQSLSAKLGIATGMNLAEAIREHFPRPVSWVLWGVQEIVAMAIDVAEFLGAAIGLNILFHIPLLIAGIITGVLTFLILGLQQFGFRPLEATITILVGVVAVCYLAETVMGKPSLSGVVGSLLPPRFTGTDSVLLAVGIIGATVMPHVIYLHSALTQDRIVARQGEQARKLFRFNVADIVIAMTVAGFVNVAMLLMAAATFWATGHGDIAQSEDLITEAYKTLTPLLGGAASIFFGISLLASGLSSSAVGTMAGQVIMQGFIRRQIPVWLRRGITMLPALIVIGIGVNPTKALIYSQVGVSFGLPFALIPLVLLTRRAALMGVLVNRRFTTYIATALVILIVVLNAYLLYQTFHNIFGGGA